MSDDSGSHVYRGQEPTRPDSENARVSIAKEPEVEPSADTSGLPGSGSSLKVRRFWSGRRLPAALAAAVIFGLAGLFLYDVASVRAGNKALQWRVSPSRTSWPPAIWTTSGSPSAPRWRPRWACGCSSWP